MENPSTITSRRTCRHLSPCLSPVCKPRRTRAQRRPCPCHGPVSRIVGLSIDDVIRDGDTVLLRLGEPASPVPAPVAAPLLEHIANRNNRYQPCIPLAPGGPAVSPQPPVRAPERGEPRRTATSATPSQARPPPRRSPGLGEAAGQFARRRRGRRQPPGGQNVARQGDSRINTPLPQPGQAPPPGAGRRLRGSAVRHGRTVLCLDRSNPQVPSKGAVLLPQRTPQRGRACTGRLSSAGPTRKMRHPHSPQQPRGGPSTSSWSPWPLAPDGEDTDFGRSRILGAVSRDEPRPISSDGAGQRAPAPRSKGATDEGVATLYRCSATSCACP